MSDTSSSVPVIFGEILFDCFGDGSRVIGGAPFNVAWHLQAFGLAPLFISRVGDDAAGERVREEMEHWGMDLQGLQTDNRLPTGSVDIRFAGGEPSYEIAHPAAYDAISAPGSGAIPDADFHLLYHGSLALREIRSRRALEALRGDLAGTVFVDVNLRPPWWRRERVLQWLQAANWVKLNRNELAELTRPDNGDAAAFLNRFGLEGLVLTDGDRGAALFTAGGEHHRIRPADELEVVDTVGAGDAFAAVIILGLARAWPFEATLQRAQQFASRICGQRGATVRDAGFYEPFIDEWRLA